MPLNKGFNRFKSLLPMDVLCIMQKARLRERRFAMQRVLGRDGL
jgi:hypothetical protein